MSTRQTIGVDIDDVIAAHIPAFIAFSNERLGTNLTVDQYNNDWLTLWNLDYDVMLERAGEFHRETVANYDRIEGADAVLKKLANKYRLVIVTARPKYNIDATHEWVSKYYRGIFDETHFVPIWEPGNTITKADICKQIGADYLIDDLPHHCNLAAEVGVKALLFGNYTWSADQTVHPDVVRVANWKAVGEYFNV